VYPIKILDVGALVFMAKIIVWEFPGFSVKTHLDKLLNCHKEIEEKGYLENTRIFRAIFYTLTAEILHPDRWNLTVPPPKFNTLTAVI